MAFYQRLSANACDKLWIGSCLINEIVPEITFVYLGLPKKLPHNMWYLLWWIPNTQESAIWCIHSANRHECQVCRWIMAMYSEYIIASRSISQMNYINRVSIHNALRRLGSHEAARCSFKLFDCSVTPAKFERDLSKIKSTRPSDAYMCQATVP